MFVQTAHHSLGISLMLQGRREEALKEAEAIHPDKIGDKDHEI